MVFVVNDLLNLTEAEERDIQTYEENLDLRNLLFELAAAFRDEALRRDLSISIQDDSAVPHLVRCDPAGLRQAISNLLENGVQSSNGGQITIGLQHIETTQAHSVIRISVNDSGR